MQQDAAKDAALEAVRGLAAVAVVVSHCLYAFFPAFVPELQGQLGFGFINGHAPVMLFFVLSGFVLTRRYLQTGDDTIITRGVLKRWPRLIGPVLAAVLLSWLLFRLDLYSFTQAVSLTSEWIATVPITEARPTLSRAIAQGTILTFFRGDATFDNPLWTMHVEFVGSFIAFGLAMVIRRLSFTPSRIFIFLTTVLLCHFTNQQTASFPIGVALATFMPSRATSRWLATALALIACYFLGYTGANVGAYKIFNLHPLFAAYWAYLSMIGAALVIIIVETNAATRNALSRPVMRLLGEFSFPLYLIHILVICSAGTTILIRTESPSIAAISSVALSFIVAWPIVLFSRRWLRLINSAATRAIGAKQY